jgi:ABC-2 type transport system permease protein
MAVASFSGVGKAPAHPSLWKTLRAAAWLGWEMESNWTEPWLFMLYSVVRPLAGVGIVVFMYLAASTAAGINDPDRLAFVFVGSTFFLFVGQELYGISQTVLDDREHYRTLKYVYIAPSSIYMYLVGRGLAKVAETAVSIVVALAVGAIFLGISYSAFDLPLLLVSLVLGVLGIATFGIMLAGITLLTARHGFQMGESVAAIFFLLGGVVFPIQILPGWVQTLAYAVPVTYWIEAMRRSVIGDAGQPNSYLATMPTEILLLYIVGTTLAFFALSIFVFQRFDQAARRKGRIDITTSF